MINRQNVGTARNCTAEAGQSSDVDVFPDSSTPCMSSDPECIRVVHTRNALFMSIVEVRCSESVNTVTEFTGVVSQQAYGRGCRVLVAGSCGMHD